MGLRGGNVVVALVVLVIGLDSKAAELDSNPLDALDDIGPRGGMGRFAAGFTVVVLVRGTSAMDAMFPMVWTLLAAAVAVAVGGVSLVDADLEGDRMLMVPGVFLLGGCLNEPKVLPVAI